MPESLPSPSRLQPAATLDDSFIVPLCAVFRRHLRAEGQRFTPERAQVLDTIIQLDRVFEPEELYLQLRGRGMNVSKATVYRTLKLLQDASIIEQVLFDQKQAHYQLAYGQRPTDQLVCVETGRVIEVHDPDVIRIRDRIARAYGWSPVGHRFQIFAISPEAMDMEEEPEEESEEQRNDFDG